MTIFNVFGCCFVANIQVDVIVFTIVLAVK